MSEYDEMIYPKGYPKAEEKQIDFEAALKNLQCGIESIIDSAKYTIHFSLTDSTGGILSEKLKEEANILQNLFEAFENKLSNKENPISDCAKKEILLFLTKRYENFKNESYIFDLLF